MSDVNEFYAFFAAVCCGCAGGVVFDLFFSLRYPVRAKPVRFALDFLFCVVFSALYLLCSVGLELPSFRLYLFLGCAAGFGLYFKSFHKIVAFFVEKTYNRIRKSVQKEKKICTKGRKRALRKKR